ncbi:hypothetical protein PU683_14480 [Kosakonia cowanii]|uniref:hypothetical protein n=1 Tax=Kosakonia cowanii TaxID=208223 RepID=UPI0023F85770|nr:hypothetical protein [Kosakonia cowanii]MDF7760727.1 hypothetical protein [Kosakonia cowanii]
MMVWGVSLIYFILGWIFFTRTFRFYALVSSLLLAIALHNVLQSRLLVILYIAILAGVFFALLLLKRSPDKKGTLYFSLPCWLLIATVLINVFF